MFLTISDVPTRTPGAFETIDEIKTFCVSLAVLVAFKHLQFSQIPIVRNIAIFADETTAARADRQLVR
jgi:hypothetical protein